MITNILISSSEHSLFLLKALSMTVWQIESMMENTMMVLCEKNIQQLAGSVLLTSLLSLLSYLHFFNFNLLLNLNAIYKMIYLSKQIPKR